MAQLDFGPFGIRVSCSVVESNKKSRAFYISRHNYENHNGSIVDGLRCKIESFAEGVKSAARTTEKRLKTEIEALKTKLAQCEKEVKNLLNATGKTSGFFDDALEQCSECTCHVVDAHIDSALDNPSPRTKIDIEKVSSKMGPNHFLNNFSRPGRPGKIVKSALVVVAEKHTTAEAVSTPTTRLTNSPSVRSTLLSSSSVPLEARSTGKKKKKS